MTSGTIPITVALRIRPLLPFEVEAGCQACVRKVQGEPQVVIGTDKAFTFDHAFDPSAAQEEVYKACATKLIDSIFKGYNATMLAYGQTGSGKTHTMGTVGSNPDAAAGEGVIPRVLNDIFRGINERGDTLSFSLKVSFLEIYNEEVRDLLREGNNSLALREDPNTGIVVSGLSEEVIHTAQDALEWLGRGALCRSTGATNMNATSSRSHAVFTLLLDATHKSISEECFSAKFHLVDLAGSERPKKTGAKGDRFKEGVNINKGLLALGNVISALGEEDKARTHVPYRDSKLTRMLQDSLGGNSHTVMVACVSPADSNFEETLNTLRYADRAKRIKNKPIVNRDPQAAEIQRLRQMVQQLQAQQPGCVLKAEPEVTREPEAREQDLRRIKQLQEENIRLSRELQDAVDHTVELSHKLVATELMRDNLREELDQIKDDIEVAREKMSSKDVQEEFSALHTTITKMQLRVDEGLDDTSCLIKEEQNTSKPEEQTLVTSDTEEVMEVEGHTDGARDDSHEAREARHALRKAALSRQLQELSKALESKQKLAASEASEQLNTARNEFQTRSKDLEKQIAELQREKEDLQLALSSAKVATNSSKVSEQRRRRLKDLENNMSSLRRQLTEMSRTLKKKEQELKQSSLLKGEIQLMKQQRVKLMKQLKEESEHFRKSQLQKDKEINQLKAKERKRQCEVVRLQQQTEKQKQMLRRRTEEAAAVNRRLNDALHRQRKARDQRNEEMSRAQGGKLGPRVRAWLKEEISVEVGLVEAKQQLEQLHEERRNIQSRLNEFEQQPSPKRAAVGEEKTSRDSGTFETTKKTFQKHLEIINAQIADLQQKILDADGKSTPLTSIHTMAEAKCAMKYLLEQVVTVKKENPSEDKTDDLRKQLLVLQQQLAKQTEELEVTKAKLKVLALSNRSFFDPPSHSDGSPFVVAQKKKKKTLKRVSLEEDWEEEEEEEEEIPSEGDDDPDWRATPMAKRRMTQVRPRAVTSRGSGSRSSGDTSVSGGCGCGGKCSTQRCGCKRRGSSCSQACRCDVVDCTNRQDESESEENTQSAENTTFLVPSSPPVTEKPEKAKKPLKEKQLVN